jgi:hypothetical protein
LKKEAISYFGAKSDPAAQGYLSPQQVNSIHFFSVFSQPTIL